MNREILKNLLKVVQKDDYTWTALLPEMVSMWCEATSEDGAKENWLNKYDQPFLNEVFDSIAKERSKQPIQITEVKLIERPEYIEFPYRGKLYRIPTNENQPKKHIILPDKRVLVVCDWEGRYPRCLSDIRQGVESVEIIVQKLNGVLAAEIPLKPGQSLESMAILEFEGQRYAVDHESNALIEMPDGRVFRIESYYPGYPVRIAKLLPYDENHHYMPYQLENWGKKLAIPVNNDYMGMAKEPWDLRIKFVLNDKDYILTHEAYEESKPFVYVPDQGFYRINMFLESMPVKIGGLTPIPYEKIDANKLVVALHLKDAVDTEEYE
jgi:hypothetical protein